LDILCSRTPRVAECSRWLCRPTAGAAAPVRSGVGRARSALCQALEPRARDRGGAASAPGRHRSDLAATRSCPAERGSRGLAGTFSRCRGCTRRGVAPPARSARPAPGRRDGRLAGLDPAAGRVSSRPIVGRRGSQAASCAPLPAGAARRGTWRRIAPCAGNASSCPRSAVATITDDTHVLCRTIITRCGCQRNH